MRSALLLALTLGGVACVGSVAQPNPITNGGFEEVGPDGSPVDWQILGTGEVDTADKHSGERALHLRNDTDKPAEVGLNRAWGPPGQRLGMLEQRKGGIRFWYKAVSAGPPDGIKMCVIPMNDHPQEVGGGRVLWAIPPEHVGDGQWHQGAFAYDFEKNENVKWVHVGVRLYAGHADLWLDDFEWIPEIGPSLQADGLSLTETPGREGSECTAHLTVRNAGDRPLPAGEAVLTAPDGLAVAKAAVAFTELAPGESAKVAWIVTGRRDRPGVALAASVSAGDQTFSTRLAVKPNVTGVRLECDRMFLPVGRSTTVHLLARNDGTAFATPTSASLTCAECLSAAERQAPQPVPPGAEGIVATWSVRAERPASIARIAAKTDLAAGEAATTLVVPERMPADVETTGTGYARQRDGQLAIGTDKTRLVLARQADGYGVGALQVNAGRWRTVALLPRLGLLAVGEQEVPLCADTIESLTVVNGYGVRLHGTAEVDGVRWTLLWDLEVRNEADMIQYRMSARPDRETEIRALEGPMLYAGEGGGPERDDAILPGLEWLARGERSSNALDMDPDHPDCVRNVPHPYKVTVPAVGMRFGDTTVGLLWGRPAEQPSYEAAGPATLLFSSPNALQGHGNHLMGLMLPAVGPHMAENTTRAQEPLRVAAGETLSIWADLLAAPGATDSLVALDRWYEKHRYPEPLPYPRGSARAETEFSLRGYFKDRALWNPEWKQWYSDLIVGFSPTKGPATELLVGSRILGATPVADETSALAAEVLGGDERSRALALQRRADPGGLVALRAQAHGAIATQSPDGSWGFGGSHAGEWEGDQPNYEYLGKTGAVEVGIIAPHAIEILQCALLTGDAEAREAGLRALGAMRRFRVPRAAQVWEVPVHTPDIYASSVAVDAFLLGYKLTGDESYLRDAASWARTGLPFVYVWSPPDKPQMQGASIPVFGATGYGLSWFGVAVQWNGLAYARSLLDLSEYDDSFPWRRVAENVLRSAMYQQAAEGDRLAEWPDAMNFIEGRKGPAGNTPPCFQPSGVLTTNWVVEGWWLSSPEVEPVRRGDEQIALRACGRFTGAKWTEDGLSFTVEFPQYQSGAIEVIGISAPAAVSLDGAPLPEAPDCWQADAPSWHHYGDASDLEIRVTEPGRHTVTVTGFSRAEVGHELREINFAFDTDSQGWHPAHDMGTFTVEDGALVSDLPVGDPYMTRGGLAVDGKPGDVLVVTMASTADKAFGVFWGTASAPGYSPEREIQVEQPADGEMHEMRIPVGDRPDWAGQTIVALRFDPSGGAKAGRMRLDSVRLERGR